MMKTLWFCLCLIITDGLCGQSLINSSAISTFTSAGQGNLYIDENGVYYIGISSGGLKEIGVVTKKGTIDGEFLNWNNTSNEWNPSSPSLSGVEVQKAFIKKNNRLRVKIAAEPNINSSEFRVLNLEEILFNTTNASLTSNQITGLEGDVRFLIQLNFNTASQRTNFNLQLLYNGNITNEVFGSVYIRSANGNNQSGGQYIFDFRSVQTSDVFSFQIRREAAAGQVELVSNDQVTSSLFLEEKKSIAILTNIISSTDLSTIQGPQGPIGLPGPPGSQGPNIITPTDVYHASGNIDASGNSNYIQGATVTRTSAGRYSVVFNAPHPNGAEYPVLLSMEQNNGADDYIPAYNTITANGFNVEIGEQDNGGSAGTPRDAGFSFFIPL